MKKPAEDATQSNPQWRGLLPLVVFAFLATQDRVVEIFGAVCKPIVLLLLEGFGAETADRGLSVTVNHLDVPWTRDCAGMNLLLVLLAVFAWMNRNQRQDRRYWVRMALMLPAAVAANVLRVLCLVVYRFLFYPDVESPQLHYFMGFLVLVPFALVALPRDSGRPKKALWFELLHIASVIGLLAPLLTLSSHWVTAAGTFGCLLTNRFTDHLGQRHAIGLGLWMAAALMIAWAGIDSFWLPWLLVCPLTVNVRWQFAPVGLACLAMACPLFVLLPGAPVIASIILLASAAAYVMAKPGLEAECASLGRGWERGLTTATAPLLVFPFLSAVLFNSLATSVSPPDTAQQRVLQGMGYELRLEGQPPEVGLIWYDPQGADRHHSVDVCLQYRGVHLEPTEVDSVKTDGTHWYKEFFLVRGELIADHRRYLWKTFGFRRDPGVHLILLSDREDISADDFAEQAAQTAHALRDELLP